MEFDVVWFDADNVPRLDFLEWDMKVTLIIKKAFQKGIKSKI